MPTVPFGKPSPLHGRSFIERQVSRGTKAATDFAKATMPAKQIKVALLTNAIEGLTGIPPVVDTRDPRVTWIRLVKAHGDFADAFLSKGTTTVKKGAAKGSPADVKIDLKAGIIPIIWKRVVPVGLVVFFLGALAGRMSK